MRVILLPGLDGTGELLRAFVAALPTSLPVTVVRYPVEKVLGYEALTELARAALPAEGPVVVLGESFSGPVAVSLAASLPSRVVGLVLCCTFVRNPRPLLKRIGGLLRVLPVSLVPNRLAARLLYGRWASQALRSALGDAMGKVSAAVSRARLTALIDVDVTAKLVALRVPVLALVASRDQLVPRKSSEVIQQSCPRARVVVVDGPHGLLQVKPREVAGLVAEFVQVVARVAAD